MVEPPRDSMLAGMLTGFIVSACATSAGMFLPFMLRGVRNLPWEAVFGFGCYVTWFFRTIPGERLEGLLGLFVWPGAVIVLLWITSFRIVRAGSYARVASALAFFISLLICVPADTVNELANRISLFLNELSVRY
jgi:hypothetical protein